MTTVTQGGSTMGMSYDDSGRRTGITYPGGYALQDKLDAVGNLRLREVSRDGTTLGGVAYAYDALGRRVASWGSLDGARVPDALATGTFDDENQLVSRDGRSYTYDSDGRLLSDGDRQFAWNSRGQLRSVTTPTGRTYEFGYDPLGRRTSVADSGGGQLGFAFDGWNELTRTTGGSTTTSANGLALDDVFRRGDVARFLDANGTPMATGAADGTFSTSAATDVLGRPATAVGASATGWKSGPHDGDGLMYFRNRFYDPEDGRFISQDPLGLNGGSPNLYAFADGDPVNGSDPTGLSFLSDAKDFVTQMGVAELNVMSGAANGATFGLFNKLTGITSCGAGGLIGQYVGSTAVAIGAGMVAPPLMEWLAYRELSTMLVSGAVTGTTAYLAQTFAVGQLPTGTGLVGYGIGAGVAGTLLYKGALVGVERFPALDFLNTWAPTPYLGPQGVVAGGDAALNNLIVPSYGGGLRRKC